MAGIDKALELGFGPIKINTVAVKNLVEPDIVPWPYGRERGIEIRYIEFMPLDAGPVGQNSAAGRRNAPLLASEIGPLRSCRTPTRAPRTPIPLPRRHRQDRLHRSVSRPFCLNCNRIRRRRTASSATACSRWRRRM